MRVTAMILLTAALCTMARGEESVVPEIPVGESPFFIMNGREENPGRRAKKLLSSPENEFPRNKSSEKSAAKMFTSFFTEMFASVELGKGSGSSGSKLVVEPEEFSIDDRREITVRFIVQNRSNKLVKLDFPTSQRMEILVRNPAGEVIEKWSDDRAFQDEAGVVMINPTERIQYEERVATREMQPGTTYTIEVSLANNPEFTKTTTVTPTGKPRPLPPPPQVSQQDAPAGGEG